MKLQMILLAAAAALAWPVTAENTESQVMRLTAPDGAQRYFMLDNNTRITVSAGDMLDISTADGTHTIAIPDVRVIHYVGQPQSSAAPAGELSGEDIIAGIDGTTLNVRHIGRSMTWNIFDSSGVVVASASGKDTVALPLDALAAGVHILRADASAFTFKFIIR